MVGAGAVGKYTGINARRSTISADVIHLVRSIGVVVVIVIVVFVHGSAFGKLVNVHFSIISVGTIVQALINQTLIDAILFVVAPLVVVLVVVVIVVVVGIVSIGVVPIVVAILTLVLTLVLGAFALGGVGLLECLLEGLNKLSHLHNVLSRIATASAVVVLTESEFGDEVAAEAFLSFIGGNGHTSIKLEGRRAHP